MGFFYLFEPCNHSCLPEQKKVVENGITTYYDYTLHGKLITHLTKRVVDMHGVETSEELHFFYDAQSRPAMVEYNGAMYSYLHNLQGDIIGIVDAEENLVVEYKYDTWGEPIYEAGSLLSTLGNLNPFRYRGYVWDEETGLYYLRSRYYYSEQCRFINQDLLLIVEEMTSGVNLFVYCANKPSQRKDTSGTRYIDALSIQQETERERINAIILRLVNFHSKYSLHPIGLCCRSILETKNKSLL